MSARFTELVVDAHDPGRLADFWAEVLGWTRTSSYDDPVVEISSPQRDGPTLVFVPVPEPKRTKNRIDLDLNPTGADQADELVRLLALGATRVDVGQGDPSWIVLADPEGNEFCLLQRRVD